MERRKRNRKAKGCTSTSASGISFVEDTNYEFNNVRQVAGDGMFFNHLSDHGERVNSVTLRGGWTELQVIFQLLPPVVKERVRRYPW